MQQLFSTPADLMEIFDKETLDEGFIILEGIQHRLQFLGLERRACQLRELTKGDDRELLEPIFECILFSIQRGQCFLERTRCGILPGNPERCALYVPRVESICGTQTAKVHAAL